MVGRMDHVGAVLLRWHCDGAFTPGSSVACRGIVFNSSPAPSGPVEVTLEATTEHRRKTISAGRSRTQIANIAPGQSVNFMVKLAGPPEDADHTITLDLGRSDVEKKINSTRID